MVASLDGATAVDGRSGGLGNDVDSAVLRALRGVADVVLVGAGTVRAERYGPPSKAGQRIAVVSNSGHMDYTTPLFTSGAGLMILPESADEVPVESIRAGADHVDIAAAVEELRRRFGTAVIQAEGGPTLNGALADADLIDELNMTIAPLLVGGDGQRLVVDAHEMSRALLLTDLFERDSYLFSRWKRRPEPSS